MKTLNLFFVTLLLSSCLDNLVEANNSTDSELDTNTESGIETNTETESSDSIETELVVIDPDQCIWTVKKIYDYNSVILSVSLLNEATCDQTNLQKPTIDMGDGSAPFVVEGDYVTYEYEKSFMEYDIKLNNELALTIYGDAGSITSCSISSPEKISIESIIDNVLILNYGYEGYYSCEHNSAQVLIDFNDGSQPEVYNQGKIKHIFSDIGEYNDITFNSLSLANFNNFVPPGYEQYQDNEELLVNISADDLINQCDGEIPITQLTFVVDENNNKQINFIPKGTMLSADKCTQSDVKYFEWNFGDGRNTKTYVDSNFDGSIIHEFKQNKTYIVTLRTPENNIEKIYEITFEQDEFKSKLIGQHQIDSGNFDACHFDVSLANDSYNIMILAVDVTNPDTCDMQNIIRPIIDMGDSSEPFSVETDYVKYIYENPDLNYDIKLNNEIVYTTLGNTSISTDTGCLYTSSLIEVISLNKNKLTLNYNDDIYIGCKSNNGSLVEIDFGDGAPSYYSQGLIEHVFSEAGVYQIKFDGQSLNNYNSTGDNSNSDDIYTVTIDQSDLEFSCADFSEFINVTLMQSIKGNNSVNLNAEIMKLNEDGCTLSSLNTVYWDMGDGYLAKTGGSISHTYLRNGNYIVTANTATGDLESKYKIIISDNESTLELIRQTNFELNEPLSDDFVQCDWELNYRVDTNTYNTFIFDLTAKNSEICNYAYSTRPILDLDNGSAAFEFNTDYLTHQFANASKYYDIKLNDEFVVSILPELFTVSNCQAINPVEAEFISQINNQVNLNVFVRESICSSQTDNLTISFGDESIDQYYNTGSLTHIYSQPGTYNITYSQYGDWENLTSIVISDEQLTQNCNAQFNSISLQSSYDELNPNTIQFSAMANIISNQQCTSSQVKTLHWDFGDGYHTDATLTMMHQFKQDGEYTVSVSSDENNISVQYQLKLNAGVIELNKITQ
ncbi:PKD domain-containing protein [Marinicellulosiphila megalodicopiae]|uniref:PKD domain-containing protein n=1 Tax=Marinicellulosiphila megalodicopiae TaxID=2724896 RepID=UPI003BB01ED0